MSFKATLDIGDKTFDLLYCASVLQQLTDASGKPVSGVRGGMISLIIQGSDDDSLATWATDPTKQQDGKITFFRIDQDATFKKIEFKSAYLTNMIESFVADDEPFHLEREIPNAEDQYKLIIQIQQRTRSSYIVYCNISSEKISVDGVDHDNKW